MTTAVLVLGVALGAVAVAGIALTLAAGGIGCRTWLRGLSGQRRAR